MLKEIINRRVPQILGSYLIAGTSLVLFIEYLVEKYHLPTIMPTIALISILGILPSVLILAYFHGAPGKDEWTKIEKIGIPVNILFISLIIFSSYKFHIINSKPELESKITRIFISKILSSDFKEADIDLLGTLKSITDDPQSRKLLYKNNIKLKKISNQDYSSIYDEILSNLKYNNSKYEIKTHYDYENHCNSSGIAIYDYNEFSIYKFLMSTLGNGEPLQTIFDKYYPESLFEIINNNFDLGIAPIVYKIYENNVFTGDYVSLLAYINLKIDDDDGYTLGMGGETFISQRNRISSDFANNIYNKVLDSVSSEEDSYIKISAISSDLYTIKFSSNYKDDIKKRLILPAVRNYYINKNMNLDSLLKIRYQELIDYKNKINSNPNSKHYNEYYQSDNLFWSDIELKRIKKNKWFNFDAGGFELELFTKLKIINVYDSTATAIIYTNDNPFIELKVGDLLKY